jgi:hypothetical protein
MPTVADLLKTTSAGSLKAPPRFPAAHYVVKIVSFDMLPFSWKKSDTHGLAYVPTIKPVSCIELDDDENPDLQAQVAKALEKFGDWTNKEFQFAYTDKETQGKMAVVSSINFPLLETDESHEEVQGLLEKHAWRFYLREEDEEKGFVADALSLSFPPDVPLGDVLEATVDQKFLAQFEWVPNQDPTRQPNLEIVSISSAP